MLQLIIPGIEQFNDETGEFIYPKGHTLQLEHSLVSLAKWESKWCKAFLTNKEKTLEETKDYIRCMTLTQNVSSEAYDELTNNNLNQVTDYINAQMSATYIDDPKTSGINGEVVTTELIYYWMVALSIPFECQKWHLNRLIALIKVCNIKNQPPQKRSTNEILTDYAAVNAARRRRLNSKG